MTLLVYLRGGFVSGSVSRRPGVPAPAVGGGAGGEEESDQESFLFGGACDHPQRMRVREVSKNGTR